MKYKKILGIDIGGSGVKGAIVNTKKGEMITERYRIPTPDPASPEAIADVIFKIVKHFKWKGPIGAGFPGVVQNGVIRTAANVDNSWINTDIEELISKKTGCPASVVNDADAAGLAEMKFGAGQGNKGLVLLITVGTGLGTVMFSGGKLVPNLEMGHIILNGDDAEKYASDAARKIDKLSWEKWADRFDEYLKRLEDLTWPDMVIIGGGVSKHEELFKGMIHARAKVVPAKLMNNAGIVGAAYAARYKYKMSKK
ncbi:MAG: ROK family protein [Bacteroidales bacterium]|nr:ROK family protein [Bacteroidales bacterium]